MSVYDRSHIAGYFDTYGEQEWFRLTDSAKNAVSLFLHTYYLDTYIKNTDRVLELGAGAGRYTIHLVQKDIQLTVSDVSQVQLDLNKGHVEELENSLKQAKIVDWKLLDITDLSDYASDSFDVVTAYGGPVSYVFDQGVKAINEMLRVVQSGGYVLFSVMSRLGSLQRLTHKVTENILKHDSSKIFDILRTGVDNGILAEPGHHSQLYTYQQMLQLLQQVSTKHAVELVSASNYLTNMGKHNKGLFDEIRNDKTAWQEFLEYEREISLQIPDGGTHTIFVLRKD